MLLTLGIFQKEMNGELLLHNLLPAELRPNGVSDLQIPQKVRKPKLDSASHSPPLSVLSSCLELEGHTFYIKTLKM